MNSSLILMLNTLIVAVLYGCGNPVTLDEDLRQQEDKNRDLEEHNAELTEDKRKYSNYLQGIMVTDSYRWFFASLSVPFEKAKVLCEEVGYQLPSTSQREEFRTQIFDQNPDWQEISVNDSAFTIEMMHVDPREDSLSPDIALCMSAKKFDFDR